MLSVLLAQTHGYPEEYEDNQLCPTCAETQEGTISTLLHDTVPMQFLFSHPPLKFNQQTPSLIFQSSAA